MTEETRCKGFTLIELMLAMLAGLLLIAAMYMLFRSSSRSYVVLQEQIKNRQDVRAVVSMMMQEIRMAGLNPSRNATCAGIKGANATSFHFTYDYDGDGLCEKDFDYRYDADAKKLTRQESGKGGYQPVAYDIASVLFGYMADDGSISSRPQDMKRIRAVTLSICGSKGRLGINQDDVSHCYNATVRCRNMGLL